MVIKCLMVSLHIQTPWLFCCQQGLQCARVHPQFVCFLLGKLIVICLIYLKLIASHLNMVGLDPPTISVNSELQSLGQGSTVAHKCPNSRYGVDILMVMLHVSVDVFLFHFVSFCFICILFVLFMLFCVSPFTRYFYHVCPRQNFRFPGGSVSLLWHCAHWHPNLWGSWPTPAFFKLSSKAGSVVSREGTLQRFLNKVEGLAMRRSGSKSHLKKQNKKRLQTMFCQAFWGEKHGSVSNGNVTYHLTDIFPGSSWQVGELGAAEVSSPLCWSLSSWEFFPPPSESWRIDLGDQDRHVSATEIWVKVQWLEVLYRGRKRERLVCLVGMGWRGIILIEETEFSRSCRCDVGVRVQGGYIIGDFILVVWQCGKLMKSSAVVVLFFVVLCLLWDVDFFSGRYSVQVFKSNKAAKNVSAISRANSPFQYLPCCPGKTSGFYHSWMSDFDGNSWV